MRRHKVKRKASTRITCRGKRRYRDHQEAMRALHAIANKDRRDKTPVRAYHCERCAGWHFTSMAEWR